MINIVKTLVLRAIIGWLVVSPVLLRATSRDSAESVALIQIRNLLVLLEPNGSLVPEGVTITNWSQLREHNPFRDAFYLDRINRGLDLKNSPDCPLEAHYVFIGGPKLPMPGVEGHIVVIRTAPIRYPDKEASDGRYVIFRMDDSPEWAVTWLSEAQVQRALTRAGLTIPEPDPDAIRVAKAGLVRLTAEEKQQNEDLDRRITQWGSPGSGGWSRATRMALLSFAIIASLLLARRFAKR